MTKVVKEIKITVEYHLQDTSHGSNNFRNLQELKIWLDKHPELAKELGYIPKK